MNMLEFLALIGGIVLTVLCSIGLSEVIDRWRDGAPIAPEDDDRTDQYRLGYQQAIDDMAAREEAKP